MRLFKNQRGVALMMVLGAILILSTMVVEFAYNSHVAYELAASERDRLKAFYLARSGLSLLKLELKYERNVRSQFADLLKDLKGTGISADPLCKMVPLSSGLLRGIASGALSDLMGGGGETERDEEAAEEKNDEGEKPEGTPVAGAEEFLSFDGDFEASCDPEERKINLNVFRVDPMTVAAAAGGTASAYDSTKELLVSLFVQKDYEEIFHGKPDEARKVVNAIADWADRDDRINEAPGIAGGLEDSEYGGNEFHYKVKNGMYLTVPELLLVAGVGDALYQKLAPNVTVYGDSRINLCQSPEEMVKAFVQKYIQTTPGIAPISEEDTTKWESVIDAIANACGSATPRPAEVAQAILATVGGTDRAVIERQITTTNRFYRVEASGTVGETTSRIVAVIDTGSANPNLWKTLYFRVE